MTHATKKRSYLFLIVWKSYSCCDNIVYGTDSVFYFISYTFMTCDTKQNIEISNMLHSLWK